MTKNSDSISLSLLSFAVLLCLAGCSNSEDTGKPTPQQVQAFGGHKPTDEQLKAAMDRANAKPATPGKSDVKPAAPGKTANH